MYLYQVEIDIKFVVVDIKFVVITTCPTKLREGHVFSYLCLFIQKGQRSHVTIIYWT